MKMSLRSHDDLKKLKLPELRRLCLELDIPSSGSKAELIDKVLLHDAEKPTVTLQPDDEAELLDNASDTTETNIGDSLDADLPMLTAPVSTNVPSRGQKRRAEESDDDEVIISKKIATEDIVENYTPQESSLTRVVVSVSNLTQAERVALRSQRFGGGATNVGDTRPATNGLKEDKMLQRAKRFGLPVDSASVNSTTSDADRRKLRAERFCEVPFSSKVTMGLTSAEEEEKKAKRREKFGVIDSLFTSNPNKEEEEQKKAARAARFGLPNKSVSAAILDNVTSTPEDAEKFRQRAARFGVASGTNSG